MKSLNHLPSGLASHDREGRLPPGSGLLIALAVSIAFWGILAVAVFAAR
ncbi:hypothetical protein ACFQ1E_06530 [Sphingomonas canadensis]|uniref:EamA family transporter n=1 Tax=Sphingomonas canadensis TaxID=1219257 RepID=A0ABW3H424_9SPHN|nr:hypothetical protein [Sphingomonas canadensis]MCW3835554.1 hypothetical protein [Sphingomonas canadensis]